MKVYDSLFCLFDLILYVPSIIFQLNRDGSSWVEPVLSLDECVLLKDHNAVRPVRLEPTAHRSRVKHSTTEPLRSLYDSLDQHLKIRLQGYVTLSYDVASGSPIMPLIRSSLRHSRHIVSNARCKKLEPPCFLSPCFNHF